MNWQPHQIVYLQAERGRLFAEIIQVIPDRQVLWLRPLALEQPHPECVPATVETERGVDVQEAAHGEAHGKIYDLRQGSDLLWPMARVRPALDLDVMPVLAKLGPESPKLEPLNPAAHQHLCHFIQQLCHQVWDVR